MGVGEHDGDVRCLTASHGLVNSAMGQIPCSTERISCCTYNLLSGSVTAVLTCDNELSLIHNFQQNARYLLI